MKNFKLILAIIIFTSTIYKAQTTGILNFTDASKVSVDSYPSGLIYILIEDTDENENTGVLDELSVFVESTTESTAEEVVLTETGINTGIFFGSIDVDEGGTVSVDGKLQVNIRDDLLVTYNDLEDDWGIPKSVTDEAVYGFTEIRGSHYYVNTTWTLLNSPYLITGDVNVHTDVTLTIEPGVEIYFLPYKDVSKSGLESQLSEIRILFGKLVAIGTKSDSIKFNVLSSTASAGDWYGIYANSAKIEIEYTSINNGQYGIIAGHLEQSSIQNNNISNCEKYCIQLVGYIYTQVNINNNILKYADASIMRIERVGPDVLISNNTIETIREYGTGIYINSAGPIITGNYITGGYDGIMAIDYSATYDGPIITNNTFKNNQQCISISNLSQPTINYNNLTGDVFGIYSKSSKEINAKNNWWGEDATAEMDAGGNPKNITSIYDQYDNSSYGFVNYSGWFSEPVPHEVFVSIKIFLEGPYSSPQTMSNTISNLVSFPLLQPFNTEPWNYDGDESVSSVPDNEVDWVLVELRDKDDNTMVKYRRAAFVLTNGDVVDLDGTSPVEFEVTDNQYFIAVIHRNHLSVMSAEAEDLTF